jgi:hypothetical protein
MTTTFAPGITVHSDAEGSIVQSVDCEEKQSEWTVEGMVSDVVQIVKSGTYKLMYAFSVVGCGDLTLATGSAADAKITLFSGGITNILSFKLAQKLGPSQWTYSGNNYPHAA